ncbi:MAG: Hemerythrin HHE cation binding domain protein [Methanocella sp. PtaU1.Bin125]|nr:MAG: Hemerythrin HHE cation binding domain protein [Methanocella sp. PtaU1.Bin125]
MAISDMQRRRMLPVGMLMIEHRLIERMLGLMRAELDRIGKYGRVDADFVDDAVDFMRTFSDVCHHGKEERILFSALSAKPLEPGIRKTMEDLIKEHKFARETVEDIERAKERYLIGERNAPADIISALNTIIEFYPRHIAKEDKGFFVPSMGYFTKEEKEQMLEEFIDFDSRLIGERYKAIVDGYEARFMPRARR